MSETPRTPSPEALQQYQTGLDLKASGQADAALVAFRRAAIADPAFFDAHREVGLLCRERARRDPAYRRPAFEAFRSAARLNLDDEKVHDAYIVAAQDSGRFDEVVQEYEDLCRKHPGHPNLTRCLKNLGTLSIAMVSQPKEERKKSPGLRKFFFFLSVNFAVTGIVTLISPLVAARMGVVAVTMTDVLLAVLFLMAGAAFFVLARRQ